MWVLSSESLFYKVPKLIDNTDKTLHGKISNANMK
jgi:hypothetical protein